MEVNKDNYKTQLCNNYKKYGECKKGENCLYAHSETELRIKNKKCINDLKCLKKIVNLCTQKDGITKIILNHVFFIKMEIV